MQDACQIISPIVDYSKTKYRNLNKRHYFIVLGASMDRIQPLILGFIEV